MRSAGVWLCGGGLETLEGSVFDIFGCGCGREGSGFGGLGVWDGDGGGGYDGESWGRDEGCLNRRVLDGGRDW